jgi:hypothetical protein
MSAGNWITRFFERLDGKSEEERRDRLVELKVTDARVSNKAKRELDRHNELVKAYAEVDILISKRLKERARGA